MAGGALPGFRDFYPDEFARRAHIFRAWREVARKYAFVEYDGPPLESLELYTKKSGDEIVGQLYHFKDKGDRDVALRPEMTPTFARMVAAKAQEIRKPVRWFSIPQLFRYERQQKGRLRGHFQLNVDIVGEPSEAADAELLGVALDCMRELGLGPGDVRARVSDRRLINALLDAIGVDASQRTVVFSVLDKAGRDLNAGAKTRLQEAGLNTDQVARIEGLVGKVDVGGLRRDYGKHAPVSGALDAFERVLLHASALGKGDWIDIDLAIVRGLAYYTGMVFELFDAQDEFRAICGGGRYDNLLKDLGGVDLPALGFGMGDVVLGELLAARGKLPPLGPSIDYYVVDDGPDSRAGSVASQLRERGYSVEYALGAQNRSKQLKAASASGATRAVLLLPEGKDKVKDLASGAETPFAIQSIPNRKPD